MSLRTPGVADPWTALLDDLDSWLDAGLDLDAAEWVAPQPEGPVPVALNERARGLLARIEARRRELEVAHGRVGAEVSDLMVRRRSATAPARLAAPRTATLDRLA